MRGALLLSFCLAAGTHAGLMFNGKNLPNGVKHQRTHMDFHKRKMHDQHGDHSPAEELMEEFENLYSNDMPNGGDFNPFQQESQPQPQPPPPPSSSTPPATQPSAASPPSETSWENGKEVVTVFVEETQPENPPAPVQNPAPKPAPSPEPKPAPAPAKPEVNGEPKAPQAKPPPSKPKPATPSPASPLHGMPSAPSDFIEDLDSDSPVYAAIALLHHNIHRTNHSLPLLSWNETLFDLAKQMAQGCVYEHTQPTPPYGQNIAAGNAPGNVSADITNGFYNGEIGLFQMAIGEFGNNSPDMSDFEHWGHATQMLWKETTSVGCYTATCAPAGADPLQCGPEGSYLKNVGCGNGGTRAFNLVCNYYPPGNYPDQYSSVPGPASLVDFVQMTAEGVIGLPNGI